MCAQLFSSDDRRCLNELETAIDGEPVPVDDRCRSIARATIPKRSAPYSRPAHIVVIVITIIYYDDRRLLRFVVSDRPAEVANIIIL